MMIFTKNSFGAEVECATGGKTTVLYDDKGYPSCMTVIPKFNVEDIDAGLGTGVHPAFLKGGVEKSELFIGQYPAMVQDGRAISWPGVDPAANINFDAAKGYCTAKGPGWHLMTNWEWSAVSMWCFKNGFQPRGNTDYGRHHDQRHEQGRRQDGVVPGTASGTARSKTGSGPASWRHDNTVGGISDMVGNVWKWIDGMKIVDGKFFMPNDNDFDAAEEDWIDQGVIIAGDAGTTKLGTPSDTLEATGSTTFGAWKGLTTTTNFDSLPAATKQRLQQAMIDPYNVTDPVGTFYFDTDGERVPLRGGAWNNGAVAGLGALYLYNVRSYSSTSIGFFPAFLS